jgi:polygalacturonase
VENATWTPEVAIRNCRFARTNTRGLLLTTRRKTVIENNTFFRTGMSAILIADDAASWFESGPVRDVLIRGNEFVDCGYNGGPGNAVIAIAPENREVNVEKPVHHNIRIEDNVFRTYDYPVLWAKSTEGLKFAGNRIVRTTTLAPQSGNRNTFALEACSGVVIEGNTFGGEVLGRNVRAAKMRESDIRVGADQKIEVVRK